MVTVRCQEVVDLKVGLLMRRFRQERCFLLEGRAPIGLDSLTFKTFYKHKTLYYSLKENGKKAQDVSFKITLRTLLLFILYHLTSFFAAIMTVTAT